MGCRYPVTTLHVQSRTCRMRAGDDTCHATRICYNAGLTTTTCSGGLCFCKFGYKYDCRTKKCYYAGGYETALASNLTKEELAEVKQQQLESDRETMYNVLGAVMWVSAAFVVMIAGLVAMRSRSRKIDTPTMLLG